MRIPARFLILPLLALLVVAATPDEDLRAAEEEGGVVLERITNRVPWPRGVRYIDGKLYAIARGVHRSAGGPSPDIADEAGTLYRIDPAISEKVVPGRPPGEAVVKNGEIVAVPTEPPFQLWDRALPNTRDLTADRPFCQLVYHAPSRNFIICGFSGVDLPKSEGGFRKNATDCVLRYDMRIERWFDVDRHNHLAVPASELKNVIDPKYYPHHDPETNPPPHGMVNGACGAAVAGDYLYVGAKDNTALVQYDLEGIRKNPLAGPPAARYIFHRADFDDNVFVNVKGHGSMYIEGTAAVDVHDGWLYVCFRTTSQILRFRLDASGDVVRPYEIEYVAQFKRYDPETGGGSSNIYDITFDPQGRMYVSPGYDGAIYRFKPDPANFYDFETGYGQEPYVDLEALVGAKKTGNICLDDAGNLYICTGMQEIPDSNIRGAIYRVPPR